MYGHGGIILFKPHQYSNSGWYGNVRGKWIPYFLLRMCATLNPADYKRRSKPTSGQL